MPITVTNNDNGHELEITIDNEVDEVPFLTLDITDRSIGNDVMQIIVEDPEQLIALQTEINKQVEETLAHIRARS